MPKSYVLKIFQKKIKNSDFSLFEISFKTVALILDFYTFDIRSFYKKKYLTQLIKSFKTSEDTCILVVSFVISKSLPDQDNIKRALSLSSSYRVIAHTTPSKKIFIEKDGFGLYFLVLEEDKIKNIKEILECLDSKKTSCYFIFVKQNNIEKLFYDIKNLYDKKILNDKNLFPLSLEFIKLIFGDKSVEEEFKIFTVRFNKEEIKDLVLDSTFLEKEKFEVVLK